MKNTIENTNNNTIDFTTDVFRNVRKMPTLFQVDHINHITLMEFNPKALWVFNEPAVATYKKDGTSITVDNAGIVFARRTVKNGRNEPDGFILAETDPNTGHKFGLEPVENSGFYKMFTSARENFDGELEAGTYELVAPKINGNPENVDKPTLLKHGADVANDFPDLTTFADTPADKLFALLTPLFEEYKSRGVEGVVLSDGGNKRVKIRVKDFFGDDIR